MLSPANCLALVVQVVIAPLAIATVVSPAVSTAAECGDGTIYDAPSNTCVVLAQALPPPPPPAAPPPPPAAPPPPPDVPPPPPPAPPPAPAPGGYWGPRPYVSIGICAPIPFVHICAGFG